MNHSGDQIFRPSGVKPWHYGAELPNLMVTYPLCGSGLTDTLDNLSDKWPNKHIDMHYPPEKMPILYYQL